MPDNSPSFEMSDGGHLFRIAWHRRGGTHWSLWTSFISIATLTVDDITYIAVSDYFAGLEGLKPETVYRIEEVTT